MLSIIITTVGIVRGADYKGIPQTYGQIKVLSADSYTSNGDLISGWHWLRDNVYNHYGEWTFSGLPNSTSD